MFRIDKDQVRRFYADPGFRDNEYYYYEDVLLMPDMGMDATSWISNYYGNSHPMPLQLVDAGYTVFMACNRGAKHCARNLKVSDDTSDTYWDFDFTDMAMYDLPAIIHAIK